ncbi:hypothetical protein DIE19_28725 [Burkholderia sp. Bp9126]|nr:hypothetical protein DIE19_28725 [Burkholderia sp. Bp9126]
MDFGPQMSGSAWVLLAAAAGAIVPVMMAKGMAPRQRVIYVGVGMLTATFVSPGISEYFLKHTSYEVQGAVAFAIGLVGMKCTEIVIRLVNRRGERWAERMSTVVLGPAVGAVGPEADHAPSRGAAVPNEYD